MTSPGPVDAVRAHYDRAATGYSRRRDAGLAGLVRRREQDSVLDLLGVRAGERILDVGCGDGAVSALAAARGARVVAVDLAPSMASSAKRRGVPAVAADARALAFGPAFDAAAWVGSSEFVADLPGAARQVVRCLRPGGRLVILFPRRNWFGLLLLLYHRLAGIRIHLRPRQSVVDALVASGFAPPDAWRRCAGAWACRASLVATPAGRPS
jgi:SAM-dependent methyltransferase